MSVGRPPRPPWQPTAAPGESVTFTRGNERIAIDGLLEEARTADQAAWAERVVALGIG